jgi:long-chain acyl-CoA synthetase
VFSKIRQGVGGRMRFFISGGAPLSKELAEFFNLAGVLILEGYGLTETSPVIAVNTESEHRFGTVGKPLANVSVKIAEDGEILTSGPCVMKGYWNNPEATAEVLENGWFHTGDIGEFDAEGYLKITDRKKDLIVTAGGKKVAPQKLEALVARDPLFGQVVALGDKRPYIIALVVLNRTLAAEGIAELGLGDKSYEDCVTDARFKEWVNTRLQNQLKDVAQFESIKKAAILTNEFSIANGELTPTLKVKRRFVMEKYARLIDQLYVG